jgi:hypothetical protein
VAVSILFVIFTSAKDQAGFRRAPSTPALLAAHGEPDGHPRDASPAQPMSPPQLALLPPMAASPAGPPRDACPVDAMEACMRGAINGRKNADTTKATSKPKPKVKNDNVAKKPAGAQTTVPHGPTGRGKGIGKGKVVKTDLKNRTHIHMYMHVYLHIQVYTYACTSLVGT